MEPQLQPFRRWLKANGISVTTGYRLVKDGAIRLTKIRSRSYITKAEETRVLESFSANIGGEHHAA